ncbi:MULTISPECIES: RHS repeat-associated core domain-containing protein [unclassified Wolbachia]|uniref:RHS repeat-associated core domain-containing protein n=1 Tax=unclassified Wolbachia TaxID=2640676 RepID=UPI003877EE0A
MKDELLAGEYPIWPLDTNLSILGNYPQADFFLSDLQRKGQENIIVRNREGLNIYEFNQRNGLEHLMQVPNGAKLENSEEKLFFPDLTGQFYKDIVALNSSGLFIYQYSNRQNNYRFINYNPLFSKIKGWNTEHINSVQFEDIDLDGRQDMLFTGPRGIDILTFDNYTNQWRSLLDNSQLTISERHSDIIRAIYANPSVGEPPIVFTQHKNQIHWANIAEIEESIEEEVGIQAANETSSQSIPPIVPQLLQLQSEEEKPTLLLRDQLDFSSIIDAVDKNTGKPRFKLPLIDLSNLSSDIKLDFFYDGNNKVSGDLGLGWSIPQNFVMMSHQSSIFPEDEKYYVILQDLPQQLIFDSSNSTDTVYCFKLSTDQPDLRIHYHKNEERWEINSSGIKQIYGRTGSTRSDSINWELAWENWRGVGSSSTGQKKLATTWYLAEVRDKNDNVVRYTYDIVNISVPNGESFTQEIYLKTVGDNQGNEVIFNYSDKEESEYNLLPLIDKDGNLNTEKVQTRYLSGYKVSTPGYQQDVDFVYRVEDEEHLLTEIRQRGDITNQSILQFTYKEFSASHMLEKVTLPTGASVEFSYRLIGTASYITEELGRRYDVQKSHRIDYGNNDVLISYIDEQGQVVLRMFNQEMTEELYSSVSSSVLSRFPLLGRGLVKAHEIMHAEDFFAVILYYNTDKELCLFRKEEDKWLPTPTYYSFNEDTMIRFGADFTVVANTNSSVEIIDWNKASKQWTKKPFFNRDNTSLLLAASGRMFLIYDDQGLLIGYRNHDNEWQSKVIKEIPGVASDIQNTLDKFELNGGTRKQILDYLRNNALQLNNNLLFLNTWRADGTQLQSMLNLFVLGGNYTVVQEQQHIINQDNINSFLHKIEDTNKNQFKLAYKAIGNKFKFIVKDFSGPVYNAMEEGKNKALNEIERLREEVPIKAEELKNKAFSNIDEKGNKLLSEAKSDQERDHIRQEIQKEKGKIIKQLEEENHKAYKQLKERESEIYQQTEGNKAQFRENIFNSWAKKLFLLDVTKYSATLNSQVAVCGNKKFTFTGDRWKEGTISETELRQENLSIPLGNKLVLDKENSRSSLKLYSQGSNGEKQGSSLLDLGVKQLNQTFVRNMYPAYLAYQEKDKQVGVVEFSSDGTIGKTYRLPQEEKLSSWSSYQTLVTHINNLDSGERNTLVFRQQLGIRRLLPNPVVTKTTVTLENGSKRITGYEYDIFSAKALGNSVYYEKISIIPGNNKTSFGWIEEVKDFDNYSNAEKKVFNAQKVLIRTLKLKEEQASTNDTIVDKENLYLKTTLLDKTGKLEVAQFFPYEIADEEVSHYGFENYEINKIGKNVTLPEKRWLFNETDVVKQGFSFTGQSYLNLSRSTLEGTFQPNNQNQEYVASCWMRPQSRVFGLGTVTPYLKAVVYAENGNEIFRLLSEVKFQSGDWFYLEVVIDLLHAKQIYKGLQKSSNSTLTEQPDINLKTSIIVSPGTNTTIDVDHVRFSPLNSNSKVNVYDTKTKQVREVIQANGLVEKYVYDEYQKEIASINEYGQLEKLSSYTKASSIGRVVQLKSSIQIQPETGFYEDFSPYSFKERWKIDNADVWKISLGQLQHFTNHLHSLQLNPYDINSASHGMRMCFSLQSESSIIKFNDDLKLMRTGNRANIIFPGKRLSVPLNGEILVAVEHGRLLVWVDGGLYFDGSSNGSLFNLGVSGKVRISDVMVFSEPSIQVTYFNALDEKLQEVVLKGENTAIVTEYLYDELGRQTITTQSARIERSSSQSVLAYYPNFVTNSNPYSANSVWKIGKLQGDVSRIIGEHSYSQTQYDNNPLDERCAVGLPGREFSVSGPYAKRFASSSKNLFINNLFPTSQNYSYQVEYKPGRVEDISVFDNKNNRVAQYTHVPGSRDLLSTYEYDENDKLVKSLPPLYHEKVRTFHKLNSQLQSLSTEEKALQDFLGAHTSYDGKGNAIIKTTPDSGKVEHLYDNNGLLKFAVHYSQLNGEEVENVIYFDYDQLGRLISTGKLTSPLPKKEDLLTLAISSNNTEKYQQFYHSDSEREPILRGKVKRTITFNNKEPLIEESILNIDKETLSKRILIPMKDNDEPLLIAINKRYAAGKLREIEYPIDVQGNPFKLTYSYNKLGKIIGIGVSGKHNLFVNFVHNSAGQVISEQHLPESARNFTRQYSYNAPGFLTKLEDKFLTEKVYYTDGSYGGHGYGDGTVTRTEFKATWHEHCDNRKLGLNEQSFVSENITPEESELCFHKLKEAGYLNEHNHQNKAYYPALEPKLPILCSYGITGRQIAKTLGEKGFPTEYGHSYDYGNYQELTKAKYFVGNEAPLPLQPDTFAKEIQGINSTVSHDIWQTLRSAGYLREDNAKADISLSHAKRGKSFIRPTLFSDLRSVNANYGGYKLPLERLLATAFSQKKNLSLLKSNLQDAFIKWNRGVGSNELKQTASKIIEMLERKQYLDNPLSEEFSNLLGKYESFIPDIVKLLSEHFARQLGEAEFDVESYDIDANGNHKHYYTGFDRYELSYSNNTNQVNSVKFKSYSSSKTEQKFAIKHDSRGNIIQALHQGIEQIDYDSVSNRATKIRLTDGKALIFYYDAQGERILKRVTNSKGQTTKEIHYIRDEFGRALVERQITYISQDLPPDILITAYIYGPRGLLGFIRRDEFYSVITDHEGSIRLVVKGDEVVAAYDYLPYGNLMCEYGGNPEAHIAYRYTGQELDEETGLYNYHARFYDPSIGRFYQIDPKGQYFSPYKYAGNSPISMIDPDGELAWFILVPLMIGLGTGGAYLGGSAANKNWNPGKWEWDSGKTWLGIVGGGIGGALLPVGFGASVSAFTTIGLSSSAAIGATTGLGIGGVYLSTAATNNNWDPSKWDFSSPETWNAAFQGFAIGSSAVGGVNTVKTVYSGLSTKLGKGLFIAGSIGTGGGLFALNGFAAGWDFSKPGVYFGFVDAITGAPDLPMFLRGASRFLSKNGRNVVSSFDSLKSFSNQRVGGIVFSHLDLALHKHPFRKTIMFLESLSSHQFLKSVGKIAGGVAGAGSSAYLMGSAISENGWDFTSAYTYHAIINGMLTGGQLASSGRAYYKSRKVKGSIGKNQEEMKQPMIEANKLQSKIDWNGKVIGFCVSKSIRKKRGAAQSTILLCPPTSPIPSIESQEKFKNNAITWLGENSVSTLGIDFYRFRTKVDLRNGNVYPFSLTKVGRDKVGRDKYVLSPNPQDVNGVEGYWLSTNDKITIDPHNGPRFIFTGELQGCSIHIKYDETTNKMEIFHRNRKHLDQIYFDATGRPIDGDGIPIRELDGVERLLDKNGNPIEAIPSGSLSLNDGLLGRDGQPITTINGINIEELLNKNLAKGTDELKQFLDYDLKGGTTIGWEEYAVGLPENYDAISAANPGPRINTTPFLYRQDNGKWVFISQQIKYSGSGKHPIELGPGQVFNFELTGKTFTKEIEGIPLPPRGRKKRSVQSSTPLHLAASSGKLDVVKYLVDKGADVKVKDNYGETSLHSSSGKLDVVKYLVDKGADVNAKDNNGKTPLALVGSWKTELIQYLESKGARRSRRSIQFQSLSEKTEILHHDDNEFFYAQNDANTDLEEQQVTSRANKTSSWINDLFGWVKSSVSGLLGSKPALPKKTSNTTNSISQVDAKMDVNGTIMLLDVLVRKVTGQKYISTVDQSISPLEAQGYALSIIERFEKVLNETAIKSGISVTNLNFDPVEVQSAIAGQIISENFSKIPKILYSFAKEACPEFKQIDKFLDHLKSNLEEVLAKQEAMILQQKVEKPFKVLGQEVSRKGQLSKKPDTFLNGTSVVQGISRAIN